jgi:DNA-binding CsgD family transcriptional regulator/PAS domain-containing protein
VPPSAEALSKLLSTLYAAPAQPELWNQFLKECTELLGPPAAALLPRDMARDAEWAALDAVHGAAPPPETRAAIELVMPHVRTALELRQRLREAEVLANNHIDVIESLNSGVVLLNERGESLFANRRAARFCAAYDGLHLRDSRLGAHRPEDHQLLCRLIERANAVALGQTTKLCGTGSIRRRAAPPLQVSAMSLSPRAPLLRLVASQVATVALFIRSPEDEAASLVELLAAGYGLTSAEARLGAQLFEGCTLAQAAERNRVSRETVRAQLRCIFNKTQVRRQTDFLRLCAQLVKTL